MGFNTTGFELCIPGNSSCSIQVMVVEASKVPTQGSREGKLKLTGQVGSLAAERKFRLKPQLGSVMRESAELALSWIRWKTFCNTIQTVSRSHAKLLGLEGNNIVTGNDIHLHFPAGAVEKVIITNKHASKVRHINVLSRT